MEGAHPHAAGAAGNECRQTLTHLGRGLVGKRDGKDLPGLNAQVAKHMRDAEGQNAGLARASTGKDQQWALSGQDRLALGGVQAIDIDERLCGLGCRRGRHGYRSALFPRQGLGHGRLLI